MHRFGKKFLIDFREFRSFFLQMSMFNKIIQRHHERTHLPFCNAPICGASCCSLFRTKRNLFKNKFHFKRNQKVNPLGWEREMETESVGTHTLLPQVLPHTPHNVTWYLGTHLRMQKLIKRDLEKERGVTCGKMEDILEVFPIFSRILNSVFGISENIR